MAHTTKIATCCYCGARTALVLDQVRHELACASCGAPLHDMKRLPQEKVESREKPKRKHRKNKTHSYGEVRYYDPPRPKRRKKRKNIFRKIVEEAFDAIEDIID